MYCGYPVFVGLWAGCCCFTSIIPALLFRTNLSWYFKIAINLSRLTGRLCIKVQLESSQEWSNRLCVSFPRRSLPGLAGQARLRFCASPFQKRNMSFSKTPTSRIASSAILDPFSRACVLVSSSTNSRTHHACSTMLVPSLMRIPAAWASGPSLARRRLH
jgi:hypothetical protein